MHHNTTMVAQQPMAATAPPPPAQQPLEGIDDIPMPTPVSVLMQTSDDFISAPMYEEEPLDAIEVADFTAPIQPEPIHSMNHDLLANRHQSAPVFSYPSLLPAPMEMIPERMGAVAPFQGSDVIGDFGVLDDELPITMEADDWAIGEGFDMDVDPNQTEGAA